jgi:hypothetical protein
MRLTHYILESSKIEKIIKKLSKQYKTDPNNIKYLNVTEEPLLRKRLYWFNILDKSHPKFKSTIAYKEPI